jgi:homeobox protein cut-like
MDVYYATLIFTCALTWFELFQGQANANDWVAEAVKDVNMMGRSSSTGMSPVGGDSETAVTLLPILQAQRERFRFSNLLTVRVAITLAQLFKPKRQRNGELEAQNLEQQQQMALLHSEVERLRTDNVALYEKVRFLQSYSGQVCVFQNV